MPWWYQLSTGCLGCLPILCDLIPEAGCSGLEGTWFGLEDGLLKQTLQGYFVLMKSMSFVSGVRASEL